MSENENRVNCESWVFDIKSVSSRVLETEIIENEKVLEKMFLDYKHFLTKEHKAYLFYSINPNVNSNLTEWHKCRNALEDMSCKILSTFKLLNEYRSELQSRKYKR